MNGKLGTFIGMGTIVVAAIGVFLTYALWSMSRDEERSTREQVRAEIVANRITKLEVVVDDLKERVRELKIAVEKANNDAANRQLHDVPR